MKFKKRVLSILLASSLAASGTIAGIFTSHAAVADGSVSAQVQEAVSAKDYGLVDNVQNGQILQCWNWSYNGIKNNMQKIAEQGFSAIQTTPIQTIKESTQGKTMGGSWWVYYQPSNFTIDSSSQNALGTKAEFKAMCDEAHKYGVKVIVDAVLNHMANRTGNDLSDTIPSDIRNDSSCWHSITTNTTNWNDRWDITHNCMNGVPDLNTGNSKIQNYAKSFLKECIEAGADGFRFDGAKHIEVPADRSGVNSQFWPNVLNETTSYAQSTRGITPYYYGEILDSTGGVAITGYTQYMSVTDNGVSNDIRNSVNGGNASGAANSYIGIGSAPNKTVQWNESHDTYADGKSSGVSNDKINKTWAMVGSRAEVCGLYLARPNSTNDMIGTAGITAWANKEVQAVNQFKNYFVGQTEYLASSGSIAYNERGTEGVVLVNCSGGSQSVNVKANKMKDGSYTDVISGSTFTVSGGQIKGQIGSTGIAVVYNPKPAGPTASVTPGSKSYKTDTLTLTLSYTNASSGQYSIDGGAYTSYSDGQTIVIGGGKDYGTVTKVSVKASNGSTTSDVETYSYTKVDPSAVQTVYFDNSSYNWSNVYAYIYDESGATVLENSAWPGVQMTKESNGYYSIEIPENLANGMVIFTESSSATTNRYPADGQDGMKLSGSSMLFGANHSWTEYSPVPIPTVAPATTAPITTPPTTSPIGNILIGDVNMDGDITIDDATEVQRYLVDMITLDSKAKIAADTNDDGFVDITDVTTIQYYLIGNTSRAGKCGKYTGGDEPTTTVQPTTVAQPTTAPQPTTQPVTSSSTYTFTFTDNYNWGNVSCYYWSDSDTTMSSWPGTAMTYSSTNDFGEKMYTITVPSSATHIIFNNGGNGQQTVDIAVTGDAKYYISGGSGSNCTVATW